MISGLFFFFYHFRCISSLIYSNDNGDFFRLLYYKIKRDITEHIIRNVYRLRDVAGHTLLGKVGLIESLTK